MESPQETPKAKTESPKEDLILAVLSEGKALLEQSQSRVGSLRDRFAEADQFIAEDITRDYACLRGKIDYLISCFKVSPEQRPLQEEAKYQSLIRKVNELEQEMDELAKKAPQANFVVYHDSVRQGFSNLRNYVAQLNNVDVPKEPAESSQKTTP